MALEKGVPLKQALGNLSMALEGYRTRDKDDPLPLLAATKAFEVAVEYAWRLMKKRVEEEGLDCPSPKAAVRGAARIGYISDPSLYLKAIDARNASVHDYFGLGTDDFIALAKDFLRIARKDTK